jgi:hypothetical protein
VTDRSLPAQPVPGRLGQLPVDDIGRSGHSPVRTRNWASGQNLRRVRVYDASVALQVGKTVIRVVLPDVSSGVASGTPSLHIIAVTIQ